MTQTEKALKFQGLHRKPGVFLLPNPWDIGSARLLARLGFEAGADVLFAPALPGLAAVKTICSAAKKPVNFMAGIKGKSFPVSELAAAGAKRISFASSLYRAAMTGLADAAREAKESGTFSYLDKTLTTPELNHLLGL